jgi:hypothetical protein
MASPSTLHFACAIACAASLGGLGCSDDDSGPGPIGPTQSAGPGGGGQGGSGAGGNGGGGSGGSTGGMDGVIDDTECQTPRSAAVEVYAAASAPPLDQLERTGTRLSASGPDGRVLFDSDGQNADDTPTALLSQFNALATAGSVGAVAASDGADIQYLAFNATGTTIGGPYDVATEAALTLTAAWGGGAGTVSWTTAGAIRSRTLDEDGVFFGPAFDVALGTFDGSTSLRSAARDLEIGIAWTAGAATSFVRTDGAVSLGSEVDVGAPSTHHVAEIVSTASGFVVLLTGEGSEPPLLFTLGTTGTPSGGPWELEGAGAAFDLASLGEEFAVLVERDSGEIELRAFDVDVTPLASWSCVGADRDPARRPSLVRYDTGYAVLHTAADGAVMLRVVDHIGL